VRDALTSQNQFLVGLTDSDRAALEPHLRRGSLTRGQLLVEQGDRIDLVHFPLDAQLANVTLVDGMEAETAVVGAEGLSGLAPVMADEPCPWRIIARSPGQAWTAPAGVLRRLNAESRTFSDRLMALTHVYQAQAAQSAACNAIHLARPRVARWLLTAADLTPGRPVEFTQEELARLLGAQRTTITRAMTDLRAADAIGYSRGVVTISDRGRLEAEACACHRMITAVMMDAGVLPTERR
jgi:CRP-like cAMP-binding protein